MSDTLPTTYGVVLLYESVPYIDKAALRRQLKKRCGQVKKIRGDNPYLYAFPDYLAEFEDAKVPAQIFLAYPDPAKEIKGVAAALAQSWAWPEAQAAVAACRVPLLVSDVLGPRLEYQTRLKLFHNALESVLTVAPCQAIHWVVSQQVVNPVAYLAARSSGKFHPLQFALNVRLFNIQERKPGEMLMDTMGLGTLGLPDLQCHFAGLNANDVARVLYNTAYYVFDHGDVIQDGHTIQGIKPDDKWAARREEALVGPKRAVIDLNPGQPYAAGERE